jgi:hypothetical protein
VSSNELAFKLERFLSCRRYGEIRRQRGLPPYFANTSEFFISDRYKTLFDLTNLVQIAAQKAFRITVQFERLCSDQTILGRYRAGSDALLSDRIHDFLSHDRIELLFDRAQHDLAILSIYNDVQIHIISDPQEL